MEESGESEAVRWAAGAVHPTGIARMAGTGAARRARVGSQPALPEQPDGAALDARNRKTGDRLGAGSTAGFRAACVVSAELSGWFRRIDRLQHARRGAVPCSGVPVRARLHRAERRNAGAPADARTPTRARSTAAHAVRRAAAGTQTHRPAVRSFP